MSDQSTRPKSNERSISPPHPDTIVESISTPQVNAEVATPQTHNNIDYMDPKIDQLGILARPSSAGATGIDAAKSMGQFIVAATGPVGAGAELIIDENMVTAVPLDNMGRGTRYVEVFGPATVTVVGGILYKLRGLFRWADEVAEVGGKTAKYGDDAAKRADEVAEFSEGAVVAPNTLTAAERGVRSANSSFAYGTKIQGQIPKRGWSDALIDDAISSPHHVSPALNKATNNPATAYFLKDGSYVVRENATGRIIQVSDRLDPGWIVDDVIQNPYKPVGE